MTTQFECPMCNGTGQIQLGSDDLDIIGLYVATCSQCDGKGWYEIGDPGDIYDD